MPQGKLNRVLGLWECVFFGVGSILGAGIYALLGKVAGVSGMMIWASFLVASLTALLSAFSYAELAAALPSSGGEFQYATRAFGKRTGGILGMLISMNGTISGAAVSIGFAGYLLELVSLPGFLASLGIILLVFLVNISGIRQSSTTNIIFTLIEISGLALAVYCALQHTSARNLTTIPEGGVNALMTGAAISFFAYIGFEEIVKLGEETRNPGKTIPRALFLASLIVFVIYSVVGITAVLAVPPDELGATESPLASIVELELGTTGVVIISAIALFATTNTILSNMLGSSRVVYDMGKKINSFSWFSKVLSKKKTPARALVLIAIVMTIFALIGNLKTVALIANFFIFLTFLLVNLAVITLRIKEPELERPYRVPLNIKNVPIPSCLGILAVIIMIIYTVIALQEGLT